MKTHANWQLAALAAALSGCVHAAQPPPEPARIDTFPLDPPAWRSLQGSSPANLAGILPALGLCDGAARVGPGTESVRLEYPLPTGPASAGFRLDQGTVRWLFRPDWSTLTSGPGAESVLLEIRTEETRPRGFRWRVDPAGARLDWTEFEGEAERLLTSGTVSWTSNAWVALTATFNAQGTALFTNGTPTRTAGVTPSPPTLQSPGSGENLRLHVGTDGAGLRPARGEFDELELFNFRMSALEVEADLTAGMWAEATTDPPTLRLRWRTQPHQNLALRRRAAGDPAWTVVATNLSAWTWTDTTVTPGRRYEYILDRVDRGRATPERYLPAAVGAPAVHNPGKVLLLVDRTVASELQPQLDQLRDDLRAEGWQPIVRETPRHIPTPWSRNVALVEQVRQLVADEYAQAPDSLRALYLIGHVPIPHSGGYRPDGHHTRPFPVDGYYGDTVRRTNDWTDAQFFPASPDLRTGWGKVPNQIGDGMFDQRLYPSRVEVPVGRVDFANLPTLTETPPTGAPRTSEVELLRRYLDKVHRFRQGTLRFPNRMTFFHPPPILPNPVAAVRLPLRDGYAWWGGNPAFLENLDPLREGRTRGYLEASLAGFGNATGIGQTPERRWLTPDLTFPDREPSVGLYWVDGSFVGDWNAALRPIENVFLRALLAPPNSGLAAIWSRAILGSVALQGIGLGDTLGDAFWYKMADDPVRDGTENLIGNVHISLLGDPTLRLLQDPPVANLRGSARRDRVLLRWNVTSAPAAQFHVYRLAEAEEGPPVRLTAEPVATGSFSDDAPLTGPARYWVRPLRLTTTGCGSFHNLGAGQSVTVR